MKPKLRLEPVSPNVFIQALFFDEKTKQYVLLQNGAYVRVSSLTVRDKDGLIREYRPDIYRFGVGMPYVDLVDETSDLYKFWSEHPHVLFADNKANTPGERYNKNFVGSVSSPLAYIVDDDVIGLKKYNDVKDICAAYNFIISSPDESLEDLLYYIGVSPKGYSTVKVAIGELFGYDKPVVKDTIDKIIEYSLRKERGTQDDVWAVILFNRARFNNILKYNSDGYYFDNKFIGSQDEVIAKIIGDKEFSDNLMRELGIEEVSTRRGRKKKDSKDDVKEDDKKLDIDDIKI